MLSFQLLTWLLASWYIHVNHGFSVSVEIDVSGSTIGKNLCAKMQFLI
jgi:hypothetical protein